MSSDASAGTRERILATARLVAQARGYSGLSFRDLARDVGIRAASVYHHFPSKAELGVAVARRYWQDSAEALEVLLAESADPIEALRRYPETFRMTLSNDNRLCLSSFMAAESDDLPTSVQKEIRIFADVHVAWLAQVMTQANLGDERAVQARARAIFAAVAGAQLIARSRSDIELYDELIESYRDVGLLPV